MKTFDKLAEKMQRLGREADDALEQMRISADYAIQAMKDFSEVAQEYEKLSTAVELLDSMQEPGIYILSVE